MPQDRRSPPGMASGSSAREKASETRFKRDFPFRNCAEIASLRSGCYSEPEKLRKCSRKMLTLLEEHPNHGKRCRTRPRVGADLSQQAMGQVSARAPGPICCRQLLWRSQPGSGAPAGNRMWAGSQMRRFSKNCPPSGALEQERTNGRIISHCLDQRLGEELDPVGVPFHRSISEYGGMEDSGNEVVG